MGSILNTCIVLTCSPLPEMTAATFIPAQDAVNKSQLLNGDHEYWKLKLYDERYNMDEPILKLWHADEPDWWILVALYRRFTRLSGISPARLFSYLSAKIARSV